MNFRIRAHVLVLTLMSFALFGESARQCVAQEDNSEQSHRTAEDMHTGVGDILAARGIALGFSYRAEVVGGLTHREMSKHDVTALTSAFVSLDLDWAKLNNLRGHTLVSAQIVHGTALNEDPLGTYQLASNLDADKYIKIIEAWYSESFWQNRLSFKAGRQYADTDFGINESAGDFINAGYGVLPTAPMPTYPDPQLGIMGNLSPLSWATISAGVYRGNKLEAEEEETPAIDKGAFTVAEVKLKSSATQSMYRLGYWRQTQGAYRANSAGEETVTNNYGTYATVDYWPRMKSEEERGPAFFARWGWSPSDRNEVYGHLEAGVTCPAVIPRRKQDSVGVGFTQVALTGAKRETVFESYYKFQLSRALVIQPDLQWAYHASGGDKNRAIAGLRVAMNF
jgi:porin